MVNRESREQRDELEVRTALMATGEEGKERFPTSQEGHGLDWLAGKVKIIKSVASDRIELTELSVASFNYPLGWSFLHPHPSLIKR